MKIRNSRQKECEENMKGKGTLQKKEYTANAITTLVSEGEPHGRYGERNQA